MMDRQAQPEDTPGATSLVLGAGVAVLGLVIGAALSGNTASELAVRLPWYISRAAGITAYLLLSAGTLLGLAISTRVLDKRFSRASVFALHEHLSWLALGLIVLHAGALLFDTFEPFSLGQVLVPFTSGYRPAAVGLGVIGLYLMALLVASFYVRARIGQRAWRLFHYTSFVLYVLATVHGILAGSGSGDAWMQWVYLASGAAVLFLINYRILTPRSSVRRA